MAMSVAAVAVPWTAPLTGRAASAGRVVRAIKNAARSDRRISNSFQLERRIVAGKTHCSREKFLLLIARLPSARPLSTAKSVKDPRR
jgi:hypothetical protein